MIFKSNNGVTLFSKFTLIMTQILSLVYLVNLRCSINKVFLKILQNSLKNTFLKSLFNKVAGWKPVTLLKKRLQHRCFPVNLVKYLSARFSQNASGRLFAKNVYEVCYKYTKKSCPLVYFRVIK